MAISRVSCCALLAVASLMNLVLVLLPIPSESFAIVSPTTTPRARCQQSPTTACNLFGGLKDAFKNDDSLGPQQNAGLKNGPNYNEQVTVNGKPVQGAVVGQKLTVVAGRARVKIPVNCQKGDCGTCVVSLNGRKVKACQTSLPSGKATIQTL